MHGVSNGINTQLFNFYWNFIYRRFMYDPRFWNYTSGILGVTQDLKTRCILPGFCMVIKKNKKEAASGNKQTGSNKQ